MLKEKKKKNINLVWINEAETLLYSKAEIGIINEAKSETSLFGL